jgi:hypothetical protein
MNNDYLFHQNFIELLKDKIPHRTTLVNTITDLLMLDRDAVYRRVRGDVHFTFAEMAVIARNTGISLDALAGINSMKSKPSVLNLTTWTNLSEDDYRVFENHIKFYQLTKSAPHSEIAEASGILSHTLYSGYENLLRFYILKWCQGTGLIDSKPFHEIVIPDRLKNLYQALFLESKHVKTTYFVWDYLLFDTLVSEIKYYMKINLVRKEDAQLLKKELLELLDYIEEIAVEGKHTETGTDVSIFISDIHFNSNYFYIDNSDQRYSMITTFVVNGYSTTDKEVFSEMKTWIRSLMKISTLISMSGARHRALFLDTQRKLIDSI